MVTAKLRRSHRPMRRIRSLRAGAVGPTRNTNLQPRRDFMTGIGRRSGVRSMCPIPDLRRLTFLRVFSSCEPQSSPWQRPVPKSPGETFQASCSGAPNQTPVAVMTSRTAVTPASNERSDACAAGRAWPFVCHPGQPLRVSPEPRAHAGPIPPKKIES